MPRTAKEREVSETFTQQYEIVQADVMLAIERDSCGSDYGGTSWTTRAEADHVGRLLELAPNDRLLDVGSGAGWPGLYLAQTSGCDIALTDLPLSGLQTAAKRAVTDQIAGICWTAAADGAALAAFSLGRHTPTSPATRTTAAPERHMYSSSPLHARARDAQI